MAGLFFVIFLLGNCGSEPFGANTGERQVSLSYVSPEESNQDPYYMMEIGYEGCDLQKGQSELFGSYEKRAFPFYLRFWNTPGDDTTRWDNFDAEVTFMWNSDYKLLDLNVKGPTYRWTSLPKEQGALQTLEIMRGTWTPQLDLGAKARLNFNASLGLGIGDYRDFQHIGADRSSDTGFYGRVAFGVALEVAETFLASYDWEKHKVNDPFHDGQIAELENNLVEAGFDVGNLQLRAGVEDREVSTQAYGIDHGTHQERRKTFTARFRF